MKREPLGKPPVEEPRLGYRHILEFENPIKKLEDTDLDKIFSDPREDRVLSDLEQGLAIDEDGLDQSVLEQPGLMYEVSKRLALMTSRRDAAKQNLQLVEARVDAYIREEVRLNSQKTTEAEVTNRVKLDEDVIGASHSLLRLNNNLSRLAALKEAYVQRSYALKDLAALHIASYYSDSSVGTMNDRTSRAAAARREMSRARRQE